MKEFEIHNPVHVHFGQGKVKQLGKITKDYGKRVFVLTMSDIKKLRLTEDAVSSLKEAGLDVVEYNEVTAEPTCLHVDEVARQVREAKTDIVVAIGGGSVIDVAKAAAICATHSESAWQYVNLSNRPPQPIHSNVLPIIAVPTTAGTGSEVTPYAVLSNDETIQKGTVKSPYIFPKAAILDPELALKLPKNLTAATGADAFTHALESFMNVRFRSPYSFMVANQAMSIIYKTLPELLHNLHDIQLREQMAYGSMLAGLAITHVGTTVAHAMGQPLGARLHLPHSVTVSIFTLPVIWKTWESDIDKFAELASCLNGASVSELAVKEKAKCAVELVDSFFKNIEMDLKIGQYTSDQTIVDALVDDVTSYMSRPLAQHQKHFSDDEVRQIILEAF